MVHPGSFAPTAHSKSAQGNALGAGNPQDVALKGRPFFGAFCAALSGLVVNGIGTQGVALGYHRVAPSGRPSTGAGMNDERHPHATNGTRGAGRQSTDAGAWFHAHQANLPCAPGKFKYGKSFQFPATGAGCFRRGVRETFPAFEFTKDVCPSRHRPVRMRGEQDAAPPTMVSQSQTFSILGLSKWGKFPGSPRSIHMKAVAEGAFFFCTFLFLLASFVANAQAQTVQPVLAQDEISGGFLRETWNNINGSSVMQLRQGTEDFKKLPDVISLTSGAVFPVNMGEKYGQRIRGYITILEAGEYQFYLTADDSAELFIGEDGTKWNKELAARVAYGWVPLNNWTLRMEQQSRVFTFAAGQKIYVEILHKENGGGDHVQLGWMEQGSQIVLPISSSLISSYVYEENDLDDDELPDDWELENGISTVDNGAINAQNGKNGMRNSLGLTNFQCYYLGLNPNNPDVTDVLGKLSVQGSFLREVWNGISGGSVANLAGSPQFLQAADIKGFVPPSGLWNTGNSFGERWRGWIKVRESGRYQFAIVADESAEFWLSSDEAAKNKRHIARVSSASGVISGEQQCVPVVLEGGKFYYLEVLFKEDGDDDYCKLSWKTPWCTEWTPLPTENVFSWVEDENLDRLGYSLDWLEENDFPPDTLLPNAYFNNDSYLTNWQAYKLGVSPELSLSNAADFDAENLQGWIREFWFNAHGATLGSNLSKFLQPSDRREVVLGGDDFLAQLGDKYVTRVRGYLVPESSGWYQFMLNNDDEAEFWLSTDATVTNARRIIKSTTTGYDNFSKASQKSVFVYLEAGQGYYVELRHHENGGDDYLRVWWKMSGATDFVAIPLESMRPFFPPVDDPFSFGYPQSWFDNAGPECAALTLEQRAPWADPFGVGLTNCEIYQLGLPPRLLDAAGNPVPSALGCIELAGHLLSETWWSLPGLHTSQLLYLTEDFRKLPDVREFQYGADFLRNMADNFGRRARGYVTAPASGEYRFYVSGDDEVELWISEDGTKWNRERAAYSHLNTAISQWDRLETQQSRVYNLQAGQKIYIEFWHKENSGGDHAQIGWTIPGNAAVGVIPAEVLSSYVYEGNDLDDDDLPDAWEVANGLGINDNGILNKLNGKHGIRNNKGLTNYQCAQLGLNPNNPDITGILGVVSVNGALQREVWTGISGPALSALTSNGKFADTADEKTFVQPGGFGNMGDNYGERWRGWISVEESGEYAFGLTADDTAELWLSTDANVKNKRRLATVKSNTNQFQFPEQKGLRIRLERGQSYYIEVLFKEGTGNAFCQLHWLTPWETNWYPIPNIYLNSWVDDATLDRNGFSLNWLAENNIVPDTLLPDGFFNATACLSNWQAYKLGVSPALSLPVDDATAYVNTSGLIREIWFNATAGTIAGNQNKFLMIPDRRDVVLGGDDFAMQITDNYLTRTRGYLIVPTTGAYRFALNNDDEAEFFLSTDDKPTGARRIISTPCNAWHSWTNATQQSALIILEANKPYYMELHHREGGGGDFLRLAWQKPGDEFLEFIPASATRIYLPDANDPHGFGYPQSWLDATGLAQLSIEQQAPWADITGGGVSNLEKFFHNLNPFSTDSDNDGISDWEELFLTHSNPALADFDGTSQSIFSINGADFNISPTGSQSGGSFQVHSSSSSGTIGNWQKINTSAYATDIRGSLEYNITLSAPGTFRLLITGGQYLPDSADKKLSVDVYTDNVYTGRVVLDLTETGQIRAAAAPEGIVHNAVTTTSAIWLPQLTSGAHKIKLVWLNGVVGTALRVDRLTLETRGGTWLTARQNALSFVDETPIASYTSPYCLEGRAPNATALQINTNYTPSATATDVYSIFIRQNFYLENTDEETGMTMLTQNIKSHTALRGNFCSNIPLSPNAPTEALINDAAVGSQHGKVVTWQVYNLTEHTGETFYLRQNDSLLLQSSTDMTAILPITIIQPDSTEVIIATTTIPAPFVFTQPGIYQINSGENVVAVHVCTAMLSPVPTVVQGVPRRWIPSELPDSAVMFNDGSLLLLEKAHENNKRAFDLQSNAATPQHLLARLGETGPVLDSVEVNTLLCYGNAQTIWDIVETYADGTQLCRGQLNFAGGILPEGFRVVITPYTVGVAFLDGTLLVELTAEDFDANGSYTYYILRAPEVGTAPCHNILVYDGDRLIWSTDM